MTFSSCSSATCPNGVTMTSTASSANLWPAQFTTGTAPNGTLKIEKAEAQFVCGTIIGNITCKFSISGFTVGFAVGILGPTLTFQVNFIRTAGAEAICGTKDDLTGTYVVKTPSSLFLT